MKSVSVLKYTLRLFIFKIDLDVKHRPSLFFLIKAMACRENSLQKKIVFFSVDYVKIIELHVAHTWCHMQSE